ncbi:anthranilate phosphoribosyltransferase [Devriesea agamarum]|uniref:anthranilate phosphoribosyltransferase n=1 Tax=Devriesea agamarum TaxID=472569 RepID=UPI001E4E0361|nr:anthranilate phosphoribosyltransferase [Devriesea agamarum]
MSMPNAASPGSEHSVPSATEVSVSEGVDQSESWQELMRALAQGKDLSPGQASWAMDCMMRGDVGGSQIGDFLVALQKKGVSGPELRALADTMVAHALSLVAPDGAVDIVGTGGDQAHTVNISTMAAIVVAACGIPVVKHGNRASTSRSGSADVLEALGVHLGLPVSDVERIGHEVGITFCFAQVFHPAMRHVSQVRRELGIPTVFNILGPMTNPARLRSIAVGAAHRRTAELMADVFAARRTSALVFRGRDGLDEITVCDVTDIFEVRGGSITPHVFDPRDFGIPWVSSEALHGGSAQDNAAVVREVFSGRVGAVRDAVQLNAAAGLVAAGAGGGVFQDRFHAAFDRAGQAIESGDAQRLLERWIQASSA